MSEFIPQSAHLLAIFNSLPGAYLILSPDLIIQAASDFYLEATLSKREDLLGRYVFEVMPDNPRAPEANAVRNLNISLNKVLASGKPHQMPQQRYDVPDPENPGHFVERHWLPTNVPVFSDQNQLIYIIHSVLNVTQSVITEVQLRQSMAREKQALWELEQQRKQLENLFLQAPAAICILNGPDLVYEFVNPSYQQLFPGRQLLGKPFLVAIPEVAGSDAYHALRKVYQTGKPHQEPSLGIPITRLPDGVPEERFFKFIIQARHNWYGRIDGVLVFAYEISDLVLSVQNGSRHNPQ